MTEDLSQIVREFLVADGSKARITGNAASGALVVDQGLLTHFVGLKRLGEHYRQAEGLHKKLWLERLLVALRPVPSGPRPEVLEGRLLPRLRTRLAVDQQRTERKIVEELHGLSAPDMLLASRPFEGGLSTLLAFEMAEEAVDVAEVHLKTWGLSFEDGLALAMRNLKARSTSRSIEVSKGLFASSWADGYDAARLLLPELWADLKVQGKPVAMAPHQDALFIAGSEDDAALSQMAQLALELGQQQLGISAQLFLLDAGRWTPWSPEAGRPCAAALEVARLPEQARGYERQKALIEAQAEVDRREEVVGPFVVLRDDDQQLVSATVWLEGTEPLLARASRVAFASKKKKNPDDALRAIAVPWDEALAVPGVTLERTSDVPERWRARGFPSFDLLEAKG